MFIFFQSHRRGGFHHQHHERPQTPQFYTPPYEPFAPPRGPHSHPSTTYTDALDFRDSRFVNIPKDLRDQRLLADRDEHLIIAQANEEERGDFTNHPNSLLGFGPPQVAPHVTPHTPQHAASFPSFEAAIQEHFGRFGPKRPSPQPVHQHYHHQEPLLYSPVPIPPNRGFRPPSGGIIHSSTTPFGVHHAPQVPPSSHYSTPIQFPSIPQSSTKAIRFPSKKRRHDFFNTPRKVPIANYFNEF